nr:hypothetical protein [Clostridia bacterium]
GTGDAVLGQVKQCHDANNLVSQIIYGLKGLPGKWTIPYSLSINNIPLSRKKQEKNRENLWQF